MINSGFLGRGAQGHMLRDEPGGPPGGETEQKMATLSFHHGCKRLRPSSKHTRRKSQFAFCGHNYVPEQYGGGGRLHFSGCHCVFSCSQVKAAAALYFLQCLKTRKWFSPQHSASETSLFSLKGKQGQTNKRAQKHGCCR